MRRFPSDQTPPPTPTPPPPLPNGAHDLSFSGGILGAFDGIGTTVCDEQPVPFHDRGNFVSLSVIEFACICRHRNSALYVAHRWLRQTKYNTYPTKQLYLWQ